MLTYWLREQTGAVNKNSGPFAYMLLSPETTVAVIVGHVFL